MQSFRAWKLIKTAELRTRSHNCTNAQTTQTGDTAKNAFKTTKMTCPGRTETCKRPKLEQKAIRASTMQTQFSSSPPNFEAINITKIATRVRKAAQTYDSRHAQLKAEHKIELLLLEPKNSVSILRHSERFSTDAEHKSPEVHQPHLFNSSSYEVG